jgi:CheY-like chemotaxis protein
MANSSEGMKLVVVDDDDAGRRMLKRALERRGFEVSEADSGATGIELIREVRPTAALIDLRMPGEYSGIDVIRIVREDDDLHEIPVIVVSASVHADVRTLVANVGGAGFVEKPVDFAILYQVLDEVLGTSLSA